MTVTLHLKPDVEAGLLEQARANDMVLEEYVLRLVEVPALSSSDADKGAGTTDRAEAVRPMLAFGERHRLRFGELVTRASLQQSHRY